MVLFVGLLSAFAGYLYVWVNVQVIVPTIALYAAAGLWYAFWGRHNVLTTAPEEVAARIAQKLAEPHTEILPAVARRAADYVTMAVLLAGLLSLVWMVVRATNVIPGLPGQTEILVVGGIWVALFILVSIVGYHSTRRAPG